MPNKKTNCKALILEDEPVISRILQRTFMSAGMAADVADNGLLAKEKIDSGNKYDVFIYDIRTPVISGIQLYEYMEKNYPDQLKKVIFMTGDCLNTVTSVFLDRVKRPFINKPFTPDEVMELVNKILRAEITTGK